jgi:catechol 2,3-dioxygenase-like lactoylglutathione lyase family enzyme
MGPAAILGGLVVLSLLVLGLTVVGSRRPGVRAVAFRPALPLIVAWMLVVGVVLALVPGLPTLVTIGLTAYAGVAVAAIWRLVHLDRGSRWMEPSQRRFRIGISIVALTWLGIVLGLFPWIATTIAFGPTDRRRPGVSRYRGPMLRIGSVVIRVDDLDRQTAFWSAALDYEPRVGADDDFVLLRPRDGVGPNVSLDRVGAALHVPPKIHLDLYTTDQAGEVRRLTGLGAIEVHWDKRPADADYVILADPEGNRFCVVDIRR